MQPRVAFFADCFQEVNGVALTSRRFAQFARDTRRPFLIVRSGQNSGATQNGSYVELELACSSLRLGIDHDLGFDLLFLRHLARVRNALLQFAPDLVHVTSPGHIGLLGAIVAHQLRIPLVASWHTNLHEFGARRLTQALSFLPHPWQGAIAKRSERAILALTLQLYRRAKLLFAPNPELIEMLQNRTARPCYLMERGIDVDTFSPMHRTRSDNRFVIGFVGRLSPEKNVRLLVELDQLLRSRGWAEYRFLVVGDGTEKDWLQRHLQNAELPGVLRGNALAQAYANMDVFVFPSETDTFGNVIQEALASGVPCVVSAKGGPKFLVREGETGFVASSPAGFAHSIARIAQDPWLLRRMRSNARHAAEGRTWDAVFAGIYARYGEHLRPQIEEVEIVSPDLHWKDNAG